MVAFSSECADVASSVVYLSVGTVNNVTGGLLPGAEAGVSILKQVSVSGQGSSSWHLGALLDGNMLTADNRYHRSLSGDSTHPVLC